MENYERNTGDTTVKVMETLGAGGRLLKKLNKKAGENNVLEHRGGGLGGTSITDEQIEQLVSEGKIKEVGKSSFDKDDQVYHPGSGEFVFYEIA